MKQQYQIFWKDNDRPVDDFDVVGDDKVGGHLLRLICADAIRMINLDEVRMIVITEQP